jgi:hypothetical protein
MLTEVQLTVLEIKQQDDRVYGEIGVLILAYRIPALSARSKASLVVATELRR